MRTKILTGLLLVIASTGARSQVPGLYYNLHNPDAALPSSITNIVFFHVIIDSTTPGVDASEPSENVGRIEPFPTPRSEKFEKALVKSEKLYTEQKYSKAAKALKKAYKNEPDNPFIKYSYAKALYWGKQTQYESYSVYKELVEQLDKMGDGSDTTLFIDFWFREAYWKLGTLHMDYQRWDEALFEISRFIITIQDAQGTEIYDQAMAFLTECAYRLGNEKLCRHFGSRALMYNPENEYARKVLAELDK